MTTTSPTWGRGTGIARHVLADAEVALRLLLPASVDGDDTPVAWAVVATDSGHDEEVNAFTSWTVLTELDGRGSAVRPLRSHPEGRVSEFLAGELVTLLTGFTAADCWSYKENADRGGSWSALSPTGGGTREKAPSGIVSPTRSTGTLKDLASHWMTHGFHGRAWDATAIVGLAADSYSDSIIVSGPRALARLLMDSDLEVYTMPISGPNPMTSN